MNSLPHPNGMGQSPHTQKSALTKFYFMLCIAATQKQGIAGFSLFEFLIFRRIRSFERIATPQQPEEQCALFDMPVERHRGVLMTNNEFLDLCPFGSCPVCHDYDMCLNVERSNFAVCHKHRTYWLFGSNLLSSWRYETQEIWQRNRNLLESYTKVEPVYDGRAVVDDTSIAGLLDRLESDNESGDVT